MKILIVSHFGGPTERWEDMPKKMVEAKDEDILWDCIRKSGLPMRKNMAVTMPAFGYTIYHTGANFKELGSTIQDGDVLLLTYRATDNKPYCRIGRRRKSNPMPWVI